VFSSAQSASCRSAAFRELLSRYYRFRFGFFVFVLVFIDENHTATSPRTTDIIPVGETALLLAPSAEFL